MSEKLFIKFTRIHILTFYGTNDTIDFIENQELIPYNGIKEVQYGQ